MNKSRAGFTLLEVMIALAVLALAAAGLAGGMQQGLEQTQGLEEKTFAGWVAENRMAEIRMVHGWPDIGVTSETAPMGGRTWRINIAVSATPQAELRRIEIGVRPDETPNAGPAVTLTGFAGHY